MSEKPKVYWRPTWLEDQDPADACWAVKYTYPGGSILDIGVGTWEDAYCYAYLTAALERLDV